jgi:hypothetical protein
VLVVLVCVGGLAIGVLSALFAYYSCATHARMMADVVLSAMNCTDTSAIGSSNGVTLSASQLRSREDSSSIL